jgi:hypothetical protein
MRSSPVSCHLITLTSKHSPQHPVLWCPHKNRPFDVYDIHDCIWARGQMDRRTDASSRFTRMINRRLTYTVRLYQHVLSSALWCGPHQTSHQKTNGQWLFHQQLQKANCIPIQSVSRDGLRDGCSAVRVLAGAGNFSSLRPDRFWIPPSLLSNGYQGLFPWG